MKRYQTLFVAWGALHLLCAVLAFIPNPVKVLAGAMVVLSVLYFVPAWILLYRAVSRADKIAIRLVRNVSFSVLLLTLIVLLANILSIGASTVVGDVLNGLLIVVSIPMFCSEAWAISLFCWALLWVMGLKYGKK